MRKIIIFITAFFITFTLIGCASDVTLSFKQDSFEVFIQEKVDLMPTISSNETNFKVLYEIEDTSICSIENNVVTGLKEGETKISCLLEGSKNPVQISISVKRVKATSLVITGDNNIPLGESSKFTVEILPSNTQNKTVLWSSSNEAIAVVNESGEVDTVSMGQCVISCELDGIKSDFNITVTKPLVTSITLTGANQMFVEETQTLKCQVLPNESEQNVTWSSSDEAIATVNKGVVTAKSEGDVVITCKATDESNMESEFNIKINKIEPTSVTIDSQNIQKVNVGETITLSASVLPAKANQNVVWSTNDDSIATIDDNGTIHGLKSGVVTVFATAENEVFGQFVLNVNDEFDNILDFFASINEEKVIAKNVKAIGYQDPGYWFSDVYGSVSKYLFKENKIIEQIAPISTKNRPGTKKTSIEFVTVHDTASIAASGTAKAHADYVGNGGGGTSFSYAVGNDGIYHLIPNDEISYHAGDGTGVKFSLTDTGVKANGKAVVTIEGDYYYINGVKTLIKIPVVGYKQGSEGEFYWTSDGVANGEMKVWNAATGKSESPKTAAQARQIAKSIVLTTASINEAGLHVVEGDNGNYFMGATYFNGTYKYISNRGGNNNSIGMETMVNQGTDLYLTWHYAAKLCASLCVENDLDTSRVKPHHFFSGKNCPQTMRDNSLWENFLTLVEAEYYVKKNLSDYTITFVSNSKEYVDDYGRVIKAPLNDITVTYTVKVTKGDTTKEREFSSIISPIK